jgi:peptide-methionine (R)-S-oxide reductase
MASDKNAKSWPLVRAISALRDRNTFMKTKSILGTNSPRSLYANESRITLWLGLLGAIVVIVGSILFADAQTRKIEGGKINPIKAVPSDVELRRTLTKEQYHVTRECGTETPFHNAYWNNHRAGIYVDVITGEPLFSSNNQFDSGTGLPCFTKPISSDNVLEKRDSSFGMERTEVRAKISDSHLGHVFEDDAPPTGERYSVNSAALRFIPVEKLKEEGYGRYLPLFQPHTARPDTTVSRATRDPSPRIVLNNH